MEQSINVRLISHINPRSPVAEAYRILRTNLNFTNLDRPFKTLLVTSPSPAEGKSTTLANLGIVMAQAGVETLIIDADLRKPQQHKVFKLPKPVGFTNLVVDRSISPDKVIQETEVPGLKVIASGPIPPNPSELLASRRTSEVIEELQNQFQLVIIDSPPVVAVTDASILASKVDGVIMVMRAHITRIDMATEAKNLLDNANARIIGVVINGIPMNGDDYYYYYYYGSGNTESKGIFNKLGRNMKFRFRRILRRGKGTGEDWDAV